MAPEQMARHQLDCHEQDDERSVELAALRERVRTLEEENEALREAANLLDRVEIAGAPRGWLGDVDLFLPGPKYSEWEAAVRANRRARRALTHP